MSIQVFKNNAVYFDGYDLTGYSNSLTIDQGAEAKDATVFGATTKTNVGGLKTAALGVQGFWNSTPDLGLMGALGVSGKLISACPTNTAGDPAYMMAAVVGTYTCNGQVGDVFPYSLSAAAGGNLVRGTLCEKNTAISVTANGTARNLGAVAAGQKLYAGLHVLSVSGTSPTLDVTINSAATDSWGAPTLRATFTQKIAIGAELKEVSGAITDGWWRPTMTIGGTATPTFSFVLILAIL